MTNHLTIIKPLKNGGFIKVEALADGTFRLRYGVDDRFPEPSLNRYGILRNDWPDYVCGTHESEDRLTINTPRAELRIDLEGGAIALKAADGRWLTRSIDFPYSSPTKGFGADLEIGPNDKFYGLGDTTRDRVQMRGYRAEIWVRNVVSYAPSPFLMSNAGWGIFVNTTWRHIIDIASPKGAENVLHIGGRQGDLDFYLFVGDTLADLLADYTYVAGKPAVLPQYAYGLTFVCHQYADARVMLEDCLGFRREGIPCDVIGLEPGWMEQYYDYSINKKWHPQRFDIPFWLAAKPGGPPSPDTFISSARRLGFKLSLWLCTNYDLLYEEERRVSAEIVAYDKEVERHPDDFECDANFGHGPVLIDTLTNPEEAWFDHLKKFVDEGACAFKMDGALQVNEHPDRKWGAGLKRGAMDDEEMHNLYPTILNKQMSVGFSDHTNRRSMIYSSGGFTGIQQYAATWAGDTGGGPKPLVSLLNHGLSGHSNTSVDMDCNTPTSIHFGFMQPWAQLNSWAYFRQPWFLTDSLKATFKFYALLRYSLMPYLYSMAHVANQTGIPIMRAMPLVFPNDPQCDDLTNHYMLGDAFLTSAFTNSLHLPEGEWVDFWTGEVYTGPLDIEFEPKGLTGGPLMTPAGTIIPMAADMDFWGQKPLENIDLHIFTAAQGQFTLYEDDGETLAYKDGAVSRTEIAFVAENGHIEVTIGPRMGTYDGAPEVRSYNIVVHSPTRPDTVAVNGRELDYWTWIAPGTEWLEIGR